MWLSPLLGFRDQWPPFPTQRLEASSAVRSLKRGVCRYVKNSLGVMRLKHSMKTGLCFGLTSAIITTLGLMVGLHSFSGSQVVVIGGILTIAIADAFSDALGIHVSEEAETVHTATEVWESTIATFFAKFLFALTFMVPVLILDLSTAILVSVGWGLCMLALLSYAIARDAAESPWKVIVEHLAIALIVVVVVHYIGDWIAETYS